MTEALVLVALPAATAISAIRLRQRAAARKRRAGDAWVQQLLWELDRVANPA